MDLDLRARWNAARPYLRGGACAAGFVAAGLAGLVVLLLIVYRFVNPPYSARMAFVALTGEEVVQRWVPLSAISPALIQAVILSEDGQFCRHWGVDWAAIGQALDDTGEDGPRGASTIPMQTIKNLFLWSSRSYVRKALEIPFTYVMELLWPRRRIIEVYLNIAELGPGLFGAEAAARHYFHKSAARLTPEEASVLAATLPDPLRRNASHPGITTLRHAARVRKLMQGSASHARCVLD